MKKHITALQNLEMDLKPAKAKIKKSNTEYLLKRAKEWAKKHGLDLKTGTKICR
jgi:hypothetical protein